MKHFRPRLSRRAFWVLCALLVCLRLALTGFQQAYIWVGGAPLDAVPQGAHPLVQVQQLSDQGTQYHGQNGDEGIVALVSGGFRCLRAASDFPNDGKVTKGSPGDAADGHFVPIGPLTPGPPFTGVTPWVRQKISGAQNLSGGSEFPPGHWALGLQKLRLVQFNFCAWFCRTNAPGAFPP